LPTDRQKVYRQLLAVRCRNGDPEAANDLLAEFQRPLLYYLRRLLGSEDDAWDCLQETWISAMRGLRWLRAPLALTAFLYRTARNHALAHLRRQRASGAMIESLPPQVESTDGETAFQAEDAAMVHAALDRVSLLHREVLTLFFLDDLTIAEVAQVLSIPEGTVKSRLHHAKRALREVLNQMGYRHVE